jgi:uncharacterized protein
MGKNKAVSRFKALAAQDDGEQGPERTCIATRMVRPVSALIRLALSPDSLLVPDLKAQLPGRGVWVSAQAKAVADAVKKGAFARSLKQPVKVPDDLPGLIERLLIEDARQSLAMANKAGLVVTGFSKVEAAISDPRILAVISASDGAEDGKRKLGQVINRHFGDRAAVPWISFLPSCELELALGRENVIHAALFTGPAGAAFTRRCQRLHRYRQPDAADLEATPRGDVPPGADPQTAVDD